MEYMQHFDCLLHSGLPTHQDEELDGLTIILDSCSRGPILWILQIDYPSSAKVGLWYGYSSVTFIIMLKYCILGDSYDNLIYILFLFIEYLIQP